MHRFTCGEKKSWQNIKKSQNIMKMIVGPYVSSQGQLNNKM